MAQVAPSILSADFAYLAEDCKKVVSPENPMLHFDVMDGVFVPNLSFGIPVLKCLKKALPQAEYDVHLMIIKPLPYVAEFAKAGADGITFHYESEDNPIETANAIRAQGCKVGLSIRPNTPVDLVFPLLNKVDMVLVMSVEPGFGGQSFIPESLDKLRRLRNEAKRIGHPLLLQVDGGINIETGPICVEAGADILVAGSAVFGAENPASMVKQLTGRSANK